jgi:hypothetical protein
MSELFAPRRLIDASSNTANVKRWVRDRLVLAEDAALMITELRCSEPGCPPFETVIAILSESDKRQYKLHKRIDEVQDEDVRSRFAETALSNEIDKLGERKNSDG